MTLTLSRPADDLARSRIRAGTFTTTGPVRRDRAPMPQLPAVDIIDQWGMDSFPASDPPANW
jgi:hypothetical protein